MEGLRCSDEAAVNFTNLLRPADGEQIRHGVLFLVEGDASYTLGLANFGGFLGAVLPSNPFFVFFRPLRQGPWNLSLGFSNCSSVSALSQTDR